MGEFAKFAIKLFSGLAAFAIIVLFIFLSAFFIMASRGRVSTSTALQRVATALALDVSSVEMLSKDSGGPRTAVVMRLQEGNCSSNEFISQMRKIDGPILLNANEFLDKELELQDIGISIKEDFNIWEMPDRDGRGYIKAVRHGNAYLLFYFSMDADI